MNQNTLYLNGQGPKARRRNRWLSIVTSAVLCFVAAVVVLRLDQRGQWSGALWGPIVDPQNAQFGELWRFLGVGLRNTLLAAVVSVTASLAAGTLITTCWLYAGARVRDFMTVVVELVRAIPVVILIFGVAVVFPSWGIHLSGFWFMCIAISAHGAAMQSEIIRAGVAAIPSGQGEAGLALGLRQYQVLGMILYPQAFEIMLPALISQLILTLKDTSLGFIISFLDFLRAAEIAIQDLGNPIQVYLVVALVFICLNLGLSMLAQFLQRRQSGSLSGVAFE
jgi:glutamate transport system permease protein